MSTPKLVRVSVTYEVLVAAPSRDAASALAKNLCPPGARLVSWCPADASEGSLTKKERASIPLLAPGVSNTENHTAEWFAREADAEKAREALKRQPLLPGI